MLTIQEKKDFKKALKSGLIIGTAGFLSRTLIQKPFGKDDISTRTKSAFTGLGSAGLIYGVAGHNKRPELATKTGGYGLGMILGANMPTSWLANRLPSLGANSASHQRSLPDGPDAIDMEVTIYQTSWAENTVMKESPTC